MFLQSGDQDKGSRLSSEIAFVDAACKWVSEKMEKVSESNVPEATEDFVKVHISIECFFRDSFKHG